jgi:hypothetical protein
MPLINSVGGLLRAVNTKADSLIGLGTGILCLPAIIAGAADIFRDVFSSVVSTALKSITSIVGGLSNVLISVIQDSVNKVIGGISFTLSNIVKAVATVKGIIVGVQNFLNDLNTKVRDALNFARDSEKCKYAAATLMKCIIAQTTSELLSDKKLALSISKGATPITDVADKLARKAASPGGVIQNFLNKNASEVNVATRKIDSLNLL